MKISISWSPVIMVKKKIYKRAKLGGPNGRIQLKRLDRDWEWDPIQHSRPHVCLRRKSKRRQCLWWQRRSGGYYNYTRMFQKPHASTPKAWTSASMSAAFVGPNSNPVLSSLPSCILPSTLPFSHALHLFDNLFIPKYPWLTFNSTVSKPHRKGTHRFCHLLFLIWTVQ